jgi:hypothetical protein
MSQRFAFAVDKRYLPVLWTFGFSGARDGVSLADDGSFLARLGFVKISTQLSNISGAHVTRDYRWWTAPGVLGSWVDDGLSFGTNHQAGVCIHFTEKVPSLVKRKGHSALTVTVSDLEGLTMALGGGAEEAPEP